jgi:hypothetical protein
MRPWLLLSQEHGYWANKWNAPETESFVWTFLAELAHRGLSTEWVTLDLEPPKPFYDDLQEKLQNFDIKGAWDQLVKSIADGSYTGAQAQYMNLVDQLHAHQIKVHAVTVPMVLHDLRTGNPGFQTSFGVPVQGVRWDQISFMAYRQQYLKLMGGVGPYLVYFYARRAKAFYGDRAGLDLGLAGQFDDSSGYTDPADLQADYAATLAGGVNEIHVYSLDGLINQKDIGPWLTLPEAVEAPDWDFKSKIILSLFEMFSRLLPVHD